MIIYQNNKDGFFNDVKNNIIADRIALEFKRKNIPWNKNNEYRAWSNSLNFMKNVLDDNDIPNNSHIAIEYQVPMTSKRVDFLISGVDDKNNLNIVVIELKQWEDSKQSDSNDVVETYTGGAVRVVAHPSYQAYSYAKTIENFNEAVQKDNIDLLPCAYLHNYKEENRRHIDNEFYSDVIKLAPIFLAKDSISLRNFIKRYIKKDSSGRNLLMEIDHGKLKPSKSLQDSLSNMINGNQEFVLIDEQKVTYETIKKIVQDNVKNNDKHVIICKGGPGTGKSVIAIQLLCNLKNDISVTYVTKNAAPRNVYFKKLMQDKHKYGYIKNLFSGSGSFTDTPSNTIDCLIADEAHRLCEKSGIFKNKGENQIKEIINAAKISVFFIDESQQVTINDIGTVDEIKKWAKHFNALIHEGEQFNLISQFRCNGSDQYLCVLDNLLGINDNPNKTLDIDYDIKLFANANKMKEELKKKNEFSNKSRMVAGYCYEWITKNNPDQGMFDIILDDGFKAQWNFGNTNTWAIDKESFDQVGCIHTSQGLEFDYCGVIIGKDLRYENNKVVTDKSKIAKSDRSSGIKWCKDGSKADRLIRNTYRTLLSRGQKGTYIYCEDKNLLEYIGKILNKKIIK